MSDSDVSLSGSKKNMSDFSKDRAIHPVFERLYKMIERMAL